MLYEILTADTIADLEQQVLQYIAKGWKPQGGVSVFHYEWNDGEYTHEAAGFFQAMVRE